MKRTTVILATLTIGLPWTCFVGTLAAAEEPVAPAQKIKAQKIRPLDWSMLGDGPGNDELAAVCTSVMAHSQDGMGKAWLDRIAKTKRVDGLLDFGDSESHIRPTATSSRTLALALRLGHYRADKAGANASEIEKLLPLVVRSLAKDHKANGGLGDKAWGDQWQSAMWAAQTAQLAWIIWDRLTTDDHKFIVAMLAHEADRFLEKLPPTSNAESVNDTKGEENAWNASCIMTASIMLINHPHEQAWRERAIVYYLNAVATPQDVNSKLVVDGKPLSERLVGYCITADYAVGNHGAYPHPGYTASSYLDTRLLFFSALAGVQPPEAILYNAAPIYRMFVDHQWTAPPYMKPGGSIYKDDGGIYWPTKKEKQRAGRYYKWFTQDVLAATYGFDATCSTKATHWAKLHGQVMIDAFNGQPTPVKLESYSKSAFFKNALSCYLIRTLHVNKQQAELATSELTCEYATNPLGVDTPRPRFGWLLQSEQRAQLQSAYRVLVATSEKQLQANVGDKWDSGKVNSEQSVNVDYQGKALTSGEKCYWKVRVWDKQGQPSTWSKPGSFEMGLMKQNDPSSPRGFAAAGWKGQWIGIGIGIAAVAPSPLLRKEFAVTKKVRQARVHISGLGWSELYINGKKVSDDVLSPSLTDYSQEVLYRTYDVTSFLKSGANAVGVMLGNGWYCASSVLPWEKGGPWGDGPRAILQMTVTYDDGTEKLIVTDDTWKASTGAIGANQLIFGEAYDARLEKPDWNTAGYDDRQWSHAAVRPAPEGELRSQLVPPMKVQNTFRPIKITKHADGGWVFEFDRFFSGWVLLKTKGKAGAKVTIHYKSSAAKWRAVTEKDTYTLKGDPDGETYEPRFTIHPVRYVRVEGLEEKPTLDTLHGQEVYSDVAMHGSFNCSNDLLNQIHGNIQQTLKVAFKGFVLDGLHREPIFYNEPASYFGTLSTRKRMPNMWTEVARSIPLAGSDDGDLSDIVPRLPGMKRKSDVSQNAAYPMLVWYLYQCHGDKRLVEHHCDRIKAWVDFIGRELAEDNHIVTKGWLGEHMLPGREVGQWEFISKETPKDFIWTCFYYHNTRTLANMCRVLGKKEEEQRYAKLAQEIRAMINKTWLDSKTGHYASKSQTSEIIALALDIVPPKNKQQLIKNIAHTITEADDGKLRVGHIGLPGFMESLVENGLGQVVYDAVNHTEFPGWGYMIDQGATTVWEGWSLVTKVKEWNDKLYHAEESMTMLVGVGRLFYESIAGIQEPPYYGTAKFGLGYRHFQIKPHPLGDLKHAEASIKTVRGIISSSWKRTKNSFVLEIEIPVGSTAKVSVPSIGLKNAVVTEGGAVVWKAGAYVKGVAGIDAGIQAAEYYTFDVGSGRYKFTVTSRAQTPVERVETEQQLVAITIDDGPHAVNTPKLLELFKKNGVKATFFVIGRSVKRDPELAKRMLAEGHELGNHTTTHADLAKLGDLEKVRKEIEDTQRILKETIGKPAVLFRAPFLSHDKNVWTVLKGMPSINASRLTTDWSGDSTAQSIFDQATKDTKAGDIVLMHSWPNKTIEAMPRIIKALQAKGLKLVTVSELLAAAKEKAADKSSN